MSKTIPYIGEPHFGTPFPLLVSKLTVGSDTDDNDVPISSTGTYTLWTVPAGCIVYDVVGQVNTAFTSTLTMTIGDSDDPDGFFTDTILAPGSSGAVFKRSATASLGYSGGKQYTASQTINAEVGTAACLAGQADLYLVYSLAGNDTF